MTPGAQTGVNMQDASTPAQVLPLNGRMENTAWAPLLHMGSLSPVVILNLLNYYQCPHERVTSSDDWPILGNFCDVLDPVPSEAANFGSYQVWSADGCLHSLHRGVPIIHCLLLVALVMSYGYNQAQLSQTPLLKELIPPLMFPGAICFVKIILLLASHTCVTENDTKYDCIFPLIYLKETI